MNVLIFCEHNPSMDSPEGKAAYPEGLGECLAQLLREAGHTATLLPMGEQGVQGFSDELLNSAEYGAGLAFTFMKESAFELQNTLYTEYFGADYSAWHDEMLEIYTRYNEELGHTFNQKMVGHEYVTSELTCTIYEDGTKVYVNYSYDELQADDGTVVPARDYVVVR